MGSLMESVLCSALPAAEDPMVIHSAGSCMVALAERVHAVMSFLSRLLLCPRKELF